MKYVFYYVGGLLLLFIAPAIIMGLIFTAGIYYFLYAIFMGLFDGNSSSGGSSSLESDPSDGWHGTGNPYI